MYHWPKWQHQHKYGRTDVIRKSPLDNIHHGNDDDNNPRLDPRPLQDTVRTAGTICND